MLGITPRRGESPAGKDAVPRLEESVGSKSLQDRVDNQIHRIHQWMDRTCWVARMGYSWHTFHSDDSDIDMDEMLQAAREKVTPSHNPRVLLILSQKLLAQSMRIMLQQQDFVVTVAYSCEEAYTKHLKPKTGFGGRGGGTTNRDNASPPQSPKLPVRAQFDAILTEWDTRGINGRDLTYYLREDGNDTCVVALLPAMGTAPRMALRGGADAFLRLPLFLHINMLKWLLCPEPITVHGYPEHIATLQGNFGKMKSLVDTMALEMDPEVPSLAETVRDDIAMFEGVDVSEVEQLLKEVRRSDLLHNPDPHVEVKKVLKALEVVLETTESLRNENVQLREQNRILNATILNSSNMKVFDALDDYQALRRLADANEKTRGELTEIIFGLQHRMTALQSEHGALQKDFDDYARTTTRLYDVLTDAAPEDMMESRGTPTPPPSQSATTSLQSMHLGATGANQVLHSPLEMSGLTRRASMSSIGAGNPTRRGRFGQPRRAPPPRRPKQRWRLPMVIKERLETELMMREDQYSRDRSNFEKRQTVSIPQLKLPWDTLLPTDQPLAELYGVVARMLRDVAFEINAHHERMAYSMPTTVHKMGSLVEQVLLALTKVDLPLAFLSSGSRLMQSMTSSGADPAQSFSIGRSGRRDTTRRGTRRGTNTKGEDGPAVHQPSALEWKLRSHATKVSATSLLRVSIRNAQISRFFGRWMNFSLQKRASEARNQARINLLVGAVSRAEAATKALTIARDENEKLIDDQRRTIADSQDKLSRSEEKVTGMMRKVLSQHAVVESLQADIFHLQEENRSLKLQAATSLQSEQSGASFTVGEQTRNAALTGVGTVQPFARDNLFSGSEVERGSPISGEAPGRHQTTKRRMSRRQHSVSQDAIRSTLQRTASSKMLNESDHAAGSTTGPRTSRRLSDHEPLPLAQAAQEEQLNLPSIGTSGSSQNLRPKQAMSPTTPMTPKPPPTRKHHTTQDRNLLPALDGLVIGSNSMGNRQVTPGRPPATRQGTKPAGKR